MADWDVTAMLLRLIELDLRGLQWQNSGGKGQKPKPIPLPDSKGPDDQPAPFKRHGGDVIDRLLALEIPSDSSDD
jgi:hypothetical protein